MGRPPPWAPFLLTLPRAPRLPLLSRQDAVRGEFREVAKLLIDHGGKVYEDGQVRYSAASAATLWLVAVGRSCAVAPGPSWVGGNCWRLCH